MNTSDESQGVPPAAGKSSKLELETYTEALRSTMELAVKVSGDTGLRTRIHAAIAECSADLEAAATATRHAFAALEERVFNREERVLAEQRKVAIQLAMLVSFTKARIAFNEAGLEICRFLHLDHVERLQESLAAIKSQDPDMPESASRVDFAMDVLWKEASTRMHCTDRLLHTDAKLAAQIHKPARIRYWWMRFRHKTTETLYWLLLSVCTITVATTALGDITDLIFTSASAHYLGAIALALVGIYVERKCLAPWLANKRRLRLHDTIIHLMLLDTQVMCNRLIYNARLKLFDRSFAASIRAGATGGSSQGLPDLADQKHSLHTGS